MIKRAYSTPRDALEATRFERWLHRIDKILPDEQDSDPVNPENLLNPVAEIRIGLRCHDYETNHIPSFNLIAASEKRSRKRFSHKKAQKST